MTWQTCGFTTTGKTGGKTGGREEGAGDSASAGSTRATAAHSLRSTCLVGAYGKSGTRTDHLPSRRWCGGRAVDPCLTPLSHSLTLIGPCMLILVIGAPVSSTWCYIVARSARPQALFALAPDAVMLAYLRSPAYPAQALRALFETIPYPPLLPLPTPGSLSGLWDRSFFQENRSLRWESLPSRGLPAQAGRCRWSLLSLAGDHQQSPCW